ncbi:MAG: hypothetical protein ABJG78_17260 [Cyclobacteriaceae bacterium]
MDFLKRSKSEIILIVLIFASSVAGAQKKPELVAPGVISTGSDYCTTLSPDGTTMYFARTSEKGVDAIMMSNLLDGEWGQPQAVSFTGKFDDTDPLLTPDGKTMYFMTNRNAEQDGWKEDFDIWVTDFTEDKWAAPYRLPDFINTSFTEGFPSTTDDGNLYFFRSNTPGHGEQDIWQAKRVGGGFDTPRKLGGQISTEAWDGHPFVSSDERFMIFYSNREGGYGSCDLYISFRKNGNWTDPKNLGPTINSEDCDMVPFVSRDGRTLYFTRISDGRRNIYQVSFESIIRKFEG